MAGAYIEVQKELSAVVIYHKGVGEMVVNINVKLEHAHIKKGNVNPKEVINIIKDQLKEQIEKE